MKTRHVYFYRLRIFLCVGLTAVAPALPQQFGLEKYSLTFDPRPGQVLSYNLNSLMNSTGESFVGRSLSLSAQANGKIDLAIRQLSADNVFTELSTSGLRVSLQSPGVQNESTLQTPPDNPVRVVFDRSGRIREVRNAEILEKQNILNVTIMDVLQNYLPSYPDMPVEIGDSWKGRRKMQIPFQGMNLVTDVEIIFTLNDVVPSVDGRMGLISASYSVTLSGQRALEEVVGAFEGKGAGSGTLIFHLDEGYFSEYRLEYSIDGEMIMRRADSRLAAWPFSLSVVAGLTLVGKS
jgi:hypothetical protein